MHCSSLHAKHPQLESGSFGKLIKPQVALGLTFNWGAFMGYSAVTDGMNLAVQLPLYISCVTWTILYDTIYARQDLEDDRKLNLNTSADFRYVLISNIIIWMKLERTNSTC